MLINKNYNKDIKFALSVGIEIPKYSFRIPEDYYKILRNELETLFLIENPESLNNWSLHLLLVFADNIIEQGILFGPSRNTHDKILTYSLHLSGKQIENDTNSFKKFHELLLPVLKLLFHKLKIQKSTSIVFEKLSEIVK